MMISLINHTESLPDERVHDAARAVNRQIREDFEPYWHFGGSLRLEGASTRRPRTGQAPDLRGDAIMYLVEGRSAIKATGWHQANYRDIPYGIVMLDLCRQIGEDWTITLSHETLELLADPLCNLMVEGVHPYQRERSVFHLFEMCDAVQAETYQIDGVAVSNFVLPSYFSAGEQPGRRNDFLGTRHEGQTLASFGINPGAYINLYDPVARTWEQLDYQGDARAQQRREAKAARKLGRGYQRTQARRER